MSDTFFSGAPHWTWFIILYFFVGGIAGGACFLAAILDWFGRTEDRPVVRTGYYVAAWGAILCGLLLTVDLGQPLRFWHMLVQSHNFPTIMFKAWSPISFGAWVVLSFGAFSVLSALGVMAEEGRIASPALRAMHRGALGKLVAGISALLGFSLAGYTGILLSVTNRPIWADTTKMIELLGPCKVSVREGVRRIVETAHGPRVAAHHVIGTPATADASA